MIVYFSATDNSEYESKNLAKLTQDKAVSMLKIKDKLTLNNGENLGIVFPVYYWGLPSVVEEFFNNIKIENAENSYIYAVASCGETVGQADFFLDEILNKKGLKLSASFRIVAVDNYTITYSINKQALNRILSKEQEQIEEIAKLIENKAQVKIDKGRKSVFMSRKAKYFYNKDRKTKKFKILDSCVCCGLCTKDCPTGAIKMINGKPAFVKDSCALCLRCLHRCPTFSIQYGKKTIKNGQYVHPEN
jgi:NAD-dependent dihydropyrimidine dehydrogenase PreA subunit